MFKTSIISLCFFLCTLAAVAQKEASKWYFGDHANINFVGNSITATNLSGMSTLEGSASLCDSNGDLLLYTDGESVFNQNGAIMPNGTGLKGSFTTTQTAVIVPDPGNNMQYYIFTAGPQAGIHTFAPYSGISYSIVDMNLAGGLGDVTIKNQDLIFPACEKLVAIKHCNQTDYWVIAHEWNSDAFYAYLVTSAGIAPPVITHVGIMNQSLTPSTNDATLGYLKGSPDGKKIASAIFDAHKAQLFDFNNQTGQLSNPLTFDYSTISEFPYGISFSPDNSKLYISLTYDIYQYDLLAGSASGILASEYIVTHSPMLIGALQIAPDHKIYVANLDISTNVNDYLYRINSPNLAGAACHFEYDAVHLAASSFSNYGLPNFNDGIFDNKPILDSVIYACTFPVTLDQTTRQKEYLWSTGDTTPVVSIYAAGVYWVTTQLSNCVSVTDTIMVIDNSAAGSSSFEPVNIFTPNNDGINDLFGFKQIVAIDFDLKVYNRWGQLVFNSSNASDEWDGDSANGICPDGTYYWTLHYRTASACDDPLLVHKGFVSLTR